MGIITWYLNGAIFLFVYLIISGGCNRKIKRELVCDESYSSQTSDNFEDSTYFATNDSVIEQPAETELSATPDRQIDGKNNLVYGAAFHLAWDKLKKDYGGQVNEGLRERGLGYLGKVNMGNLLEVKNYVVDHGPGKIVYPRIDMNLQEKFNRSVNDLLLLPSDTFIIFGYLEKFLTFREPFWPAEINFSGVNVHAIKSDHYKNLEKVEISHYQFGQSEDYAPGDFVFRLSPEDSAHELIIAKVKPEGTLIDTYNKVKKKFGAHTELFKEGGREKKATFPKNGITTDYVAIPKLNFVISSQINSIHGFVVKGPGYNIEWSVNFVRFRLDERGAWVMNYAAAAPADTAEVEKIPPLVADRPFLLAMKRKNHDHPYMMVWVQNDKILLRKREVRKK